VNECNVACNALGLDQSTQHNVTPTVNRLHHSQLNDMSVGNSCCLCWTVLSAPQSDNLCL